MQDTIKVWDKIASVYEAKFMKLELYNESYDLLCQLMTNGAYVLEVGCGPGNISHYLYSKRNDIHILATDASENMVKLAKKNNPETDCMVLDVREIISLERSFDLIVAGFCLPYLFQLEANKFFEDSFHLLNIGGLLYVSFVQGDVDQSGVLEGSTGDSIYFNYYETEIVLNQLNELGFSIVKVFEFSYHNQPDQLEKHIVVLAEKTV